MLNNLDIWTLLKNISLRKIRLLVLLFGLVTIIIPTFIVCLMINPNKPCRSDDIVQKTQCRILNGKMTKRIINQEYPKSSSGVKFIGVVGKGCFDDAGATVPVCAVTYEPKAE